MGETEVTYNLELLEQSRRAWEASPGLRDYYGGMFRAIRALCRAGRILEVGSGIAVSKDFFEGLTTSDVEKTPFVDRRISAYAIDTPGEGKWSTIFAVDVFHHLREPLKFLESAASALENGGRLILAEPAATPFGRLFYRLCHHEPMVLNLIKAPYVFEPNGPDGEFANMAMAVGLFGKRNEDRNGMLDDLGFRLHSVRYRDFASYPLTGGFSRPQLVPTPLLKLVLGFDAVLPQFILSRLGLRAIVCLEKAGAEQGQAFRRTSVCGRQRPPS